MIPPLVYIETNWIVGAVMGQEPEADELMASPSVRLILPSVCVMEALKSFEGKRRARNELTSDIDREIKDVRRSTGIREARELATHLQEAKLQNDALLDQLYKRLDGWLARAVERAELLHPTSTDVTLACDLALITEGERADLLILTLIVRHARTEPGTSKALLTGDRRFGGVAQSSLDDAGVRIFHQAKSVLGWAASQG